MSKASLTRISLCDEARAQENYEEYDTTGNKNSDSWPANSSAKHGRVQGVQEHRQQQQLTWTVSGTETLRPLVQLQGPIKKATW